MRLAKTFDQLAQEQADANLKSYYEKLAYYSYYLGGAEGEMDSVPGLDIMQLNKVTNEDYTKGKRAAGYLQLPQRAEQSASESTSRPQPR